MSNREIIVGLDIGTTKIAALVGEQVDKNKLNILGYGTAPSKDAVVRGIVINIDRTVEAIRVAIERAANMANVDIKSVYVGIAGQDVKCLHHRGQITRNNAEDEISQEDIDRLMSDMHKVALDPGEEIIHVIPQDYIVDNERGIKHPIGMAGVRLEGNFHIITAQTTATKNISRCITKANLTEIDTILEPLASAEAVLFEEEKEAGVALIDIGGGTTDIAIFQDNILRHTAVIPLGGEVITNDIKIGCNVLYSQAEKLKIKFGSALANEAKQNVRISIPMLKDRPPREISSVNLAKIIQSRVEEIFDHVIFQIKSSGYEKKLQGGIVLTGGGALLKHLPQLVEYRTGIDVRLGYPAEYLAKGVIEDINSPVYSTGIGLMLFALKNAKKEVKEIEKGNQPIRRSGFSSIASKIKEWLKDGQEDFKN